MYILFTDEEMKWLNKTDFNWTIKEGCPKDIRNALERKMTILMNQGGVK